MLPLPAAQLSCRSAAAPQTATDPLQCPCSSACTSPGVEMECSSAGPMWASGAGGCMAWAAGLRRGKHISLQVLSGPCMPDPDFPKTGGARHAASRTSQTMAARTCGTCRWRAGRTAAAPAPRLRQEGRYSDASYFASMDLAGMGVRQATVATTAWPRVNQTQPGCLCCTEQAPHLTALAAPWWLAAG